MQKLQTTDEPYGSSHTFTGTTLYRLEKFVYEKGTNVALYNAEHSKEYKNFKDSINSSLDAQIQKIAVARTIDSLLLFSKAKIVNKELVVAVGGALGTKLLQYDIDITTYLTWAGTQGGQAALDKMGINGAFNLKNQAVIDYFDDYGNLMIRSVDNYTKEWIANKIQDGKENRLTPSEIAQTLVDDGKAINKVRAERIVVTETAKAMSFVEMKAAEQMGIEEVIWRTSIDERVCPICSPLEGVRQRIGRTFGAGFDGPPAHVSCRCFLEEVIPASWELTNIWTGE